jgi:hypothetical protein
MENTKIEPVASYQDVELNKESILKENKKMSGIYC